MVVAAVVVSAAIGMISFWAGGHDGSPAVGVSTVLGVTGVAIFDFAFAPSTITVPSGGTVIWSNADGLAHTVASTDGSFGSDSLATGAMFRHTFERSGTFTYICNLHPSMAGTVVVD